MKIANLNDTEIKNQLVIMIKWLGYKNDWPGNEYSWWWIGNEPLEVKDMIQISSLMNNELALLQFLIRITYKISIVTPFKIDCFQYEWNVSIEAKSINNRSKSLNEALFLSISNYIK